MKFLSGIKRLLREERFVVHDNVIDMDRYRLKQVRQQAQKYGLKPEDLRLYVTKDPGPKPIVAFLDGKVFYVTKRGLQR